LSSSQSIPRRGKSSPGKGLTPKNGGKFLQCPFCRPRSKAYRIRKKSNNCQDFGRRKNAQSRGETNPYKSPYSAEARLLQPSIRRGETTPIGGEPSLWGTQPVTITSSYILRQMPVSGQRKPERGGDTALTYCVRKKDT